MFFGPIGHTQISVIFDRFGPIDPNQKRGAKIEKFVFSIPDPIFARSKMNLARVFFTKFVSRTKSSIELFSHVRNFLTLAVF
jgi:hypothetical protein